MTVISLETARKLKDAGLKWKPEPKDDFAYYNGQKTSWLHEYYPAVCDYPERFIWLPSLKQLLTEIEKRGYGYRLCPDSIALYKKAMDGALIDVYPTRSMNLIPMKNTEAAAQALLWILEQKAGEL